MFARSQIQKLDGLIEIRYQIQKLDALIEIRYQIQIRYQNFSIRPLAFLGSNSKLDGLMQYLMGQI